MINVKKEGILLEKTDLEFENDGVLNPAAIRDGDSVHMFYRAVQKGNRSSIGYCRLEGSLTVAERSTNAFMIPEFDYESQGVEDVFPTGTVLFGTTLFIYYGAADSRIACALLNLPELVDELLIYKTVKNEK